jgi:probable addiction module antidote protein
MSEKPVNRGEIADHINEAFKSSDIEAICRAIGDAIRLHNMSDIAKKSGVERTSIYRAFAGPHVPSLSTVVHVLDAMGLQLKVVTHRRKAARPRPQNSKVSTSR